MHPGGLASDQMRPYSPLVLNTIQHTWLGFTPFSTGL
jgi:hypothetical protein